MLPAWVYVITAAIASNSYSLNKLYPTAAARAGLAASGGRNPALVFLYGRLWGDSLGAVSAWRYGVWAAIFAALMSVFLVIRHTRADEEAGRLELVGSAAVGRLAALTAALLVALAANVVLAVLLVVVLVVLGLPVAGSVAFALAITTCGLAFAAIAALAAQLAAGARAARGIAIGVLGAAYLLRAVGDASGTGGVSWLTWLSPLGWTELTRPYTADRWWVLALPLALTAAATAGAYVLVVLRDHGAGLLPDRPGRAAASALRCAARSAWPGGCSGARCTAGRRASPSPSPPAVRRPRGSARCSAAAASSGTPSPGSAGRPGSPTPTWPRSCRWPGWPPRRTPPRRCCGCAPRRPAARPNPCWPRRSAGPGGGSATSPSPSSARRSCSPWRAWPRASATGCAPAPPDPRWPACSARAMVQLPASLAVAGAAVVLFGLVPRASVAGAWTVVGVLVLIALFGQVLQLSQSILDVSPFTHVPKLPGAAVTVHTTGAPLLWLSLAVAGPGRRGPGRPAPPRHRLTSAQSEHEAL